MLDPNQPLISFEQVTNMLKDIEQTHSKIMSNTEAYGIQYRMLKSLYSNLHFKLQGLYKPIENLEERLTTSSIGYQNTKSLSDRWRILPLVTLLDSHRGGDHFGVSHQT
jgi:hypothetical protein